MADTNVELEAIRGAYIRAETNLRLVAWLVILAGVVRVVLGVVQVRADPHAAAWVILQGAFLVWCGVSLWQLEAFGRIATSIVLAILFVGYAITTVYTAAIGAWIAVPVAIATVTFAVLLRLVWNRRAKAICSAHYRDDVVPATRHVKPAIDRLVVGTLVLLVIAFVATTAF